MDIVFINPTQFNTLFYLFTLVIGMDFTVSGFCIFRDQNAKHVPKFISFLFLKAFEKNEKILAERKYSKKPLTKLARILLSINAAGYFLLIGGVLMILASLFQFI